MLKDPTLANEKEIIKSCQSGDTRLFAILYDHYIDSIYRFVYYKTRHKETAEDIVSQTFFKALQSIKKVDLEKSFSAWLYRIARNQVIDHYRQKRTHADIDDMWDLGEEADLIGDLDRSASFKKVEKYLKNLQPEERDIIILRVWQELSYKEISEVLGKSEGACKMSFSRSIEKLRKTVPLGLLLFILMKL